MLIPPLVCYIGCTDGNNQIQGTSPPFTFFPQPPHEPSLARLLTPLFVWMFQVQLYSEPDFQGRLVALEDSAAALDEDFIPKSCKVLAGR